MDNILIVEDDITLLKLLKQAFEAKSYQVEAAPNGKVALDIIKNKKPDLIVLDLVMPVMDGNEFLDVMRQDDENKKIPVIVCTNISNIESVNNALKHQTGAYLIKADNNIEDIIKAAVDILHN